MLPNCATHHILFTIVSTSPIMMEVNYFQELKNFLSGGIFSYFNGEDLDGGFYNFIEEYNLF